MNLEDEDILIEKFIEGALSNEDLVIFLKRRNTDKEFEKKVLLEQQLREALNDADWSFASKQTAVSKSYEEILKGEDFKKLRNVVQDVNASHQKSKKSASLKWILFASAATIALLISISVFDSNPSVNELYEIYSKDTNLPSFISREDGNENSLIRAQEFFENKEFDKSLKLFEKELKNSSKPDPGLYLYIGIAQMELAQYKEAEKTFNTLINSNLIDAPKGLWHKALLYLKMERLEDSKSLLNTIKRDKKYNYRKAAELLKKLS